MDTERLGRPSIAGLYRDFGRDWEIEPIPAGTKWIAVQRGNGDTITIVVANEVSTLRFRMNRAGREGPAEPA
jgi:hypothetical protein